MENFNGFYFVTEENVSLEKFNQKITDAISFLIKSNNLNDDSIKQIRHSFNQTYQIQGRNFYGQYLTFEISKDGEINNHLDCFIDNQNLYMEVITN